MAHTKAGGTVKTGRDSAGQRLGVKKYGSELIKPGNIIIRQKGMEVYPGDNVVAGKDHTLLAKAEGTVTFYRRHKKKFNNRWVSTKFVKVVTNKTK